MAATVIGPCRCPLCGGTARLSLAKTQLPVMTMNCCNAQLFARSDRSDALMRGLLLDRGSPPAVDPGSIDPAPAPAPGPEPVRTETPAPPAAPAPAPIFGGLIKW